MLNTAEKIKLTFIGEDYWGNPTYKSESGCYYKNINWNSEILQLCDVSPAMDFMGEPNTPINMGMVEIIKGDKPQQNNHLRRDYMMLSRYLQDYNYYHGYGNKNEKHLYFLDYKTHLEEMVKLYQKLIKFGPIEWFSGEFFNKIESELQGM